MTREEQIRSKAKELGKKYFPDEANIWARENIEAVDAENACVEMAEWLDQHPQWIPVEERLPEIPKNDWKSDNVLFVVNGEIFYGYRGKYTWFAPFVSFNNHEVTHWKDIVPPKNED